MILVTLDEMYNKYVKVKEYFESFEEFIELNFPTWRYVYV